MIGKLTKLRIIRYPSSDGTLQDFATGRAWAMQSSFRVDEAIASDDIVKLKPGTMIQRLLFWHITGAMVDTT